MKKLAVIVSMFLFLATATYAAPKPTDDMNETIAEYENVQAQWYAKEALGMLFSEIVYNGWEVKVDKKGEKTVKVNWKNAFTEKTLKKEFGNSTQYLKIGLATLIGDKVAPITEVEAKQFFTDMQLTSQLEDLRLKYDSDHKKFKEEYEFLKEYGIVTITEENGVLQKYAELQEWRDELMDEYSDLD